MSPVMRKKGKYGAFKAHSPLLFFLACFISTTRTQVYTKYGYQLRWQEFTEYGNKIGWHLKPVDTMDGDTSDEERTNLPTSGTS